MFAGSFPHFVEVDEVCVGEGFSYDGFGIMIGWMINRRCFLQWLCWVANVYIHHQGDLAKLVNANKSKLFHVIFVHKKNGQNRPAFNQTVFRPWDFLVLFQHFCCCKDFGWFHRNKNTEHLKTFMSWWCGELPPGGWFRKKTGDLPTARGGWRYLWIHRSLGETVRWKLLGSSPCGLKQKQSFPQQMKCLEKWVKIGVDASNPDS